MIPTTPRSIIEIQQGLTTGQPRPTTRRQPVRRITTRCADRLVECDPDHYVILWDKASCRSQLLVEAIAGVLNAKLLDWGDRPFGDALRGIAYDGENLWALDNRNKRICIIEKIESGPELSAASAAKLRGGN